MDNISNISPSSFYKNSNSRKYLPTKLLQDSQGSIPYRMRSLTDGPPLTWKVFKKQVEALNFISMHKFHLMAFAFESGPTRLFLAAHPEVFWHYDTQRSPSSRCTYEVIPENTACKLYFDIEFNKEINPSKNGDMMVQNFITIIIFYLNLHYKLECKPEFVLNLDSSTDSKFSCHLIFDIPDACFSNNKEAGKFVHFVCNEIIAVTIKNSIPERLNFMSLIDFNDLLVKDSKGNFNLFCDKSVYSRNRHFRLYRSTKYGKCAPLVLSSYNKFTPPSTSSDIIYSEREIFYSSLITYLPHNFERLRILNFDCIPNVSEIVKDKEMSEIVENNNYESSPFVAVDDFIKDIVFPGTIYRNCYFSSSRVINYDIMGNRFCGNVGRPHRRNNIKYVVDLKEGVYYQKCHDFECAGYRSEKKSLPEKLQIVCEPQDNSTLGSFEISPPNSVEKHSFQRFPSCGLSDEEIINHLTSEETVSPNNSQKYPYQHFPSCGLSDEEMIDHLSTAHGTSF